jgi:Protein of unknown function (DUF3352)
MSDHTAVLSEPQQPRRRGSFGLLAVIASVTVVVLIAVGGFAAWRLLSGGGPRPAEVLPATTFALVTVDLDPSGDQKVEAITTLRKFPSFRKRSGLEPESDPRKRLFDEVQDEGSCEELDYERDIKSWLGQRAGFGAVLLEDEPVPVAALQVSDPDNAKPGFTRLAECAELEGDDFGWTLVGDYIVVSDSTEHARTIAAQGEKSPLSDDAAYQEWTDEAGGAGIVNAYVGRAVVDVASEQLGSGLDDLGGLGDDLTGSGGEEDAADALAAYKDFKGAAAVLRFADGGIELSVAGGGGKTVEGKETVGEHVEAMPRDTALLLALAVPPGAFDALEEADEGGTGSDFLGDMLGIDFPDDLRTLLGKSLSISLGGDAPDDLASIDGLGDLSIGALIRGESDEIEAVIEKLEQSSGTTLADLEVTRTSEDGKVAIASTSDYADQLLGSGSLADDEGFEDAVPNAEDAQFIAYADFDGEWGDAVIDLVREDGDAESEELADNLAVVRAFGASAWTDGDVSHGLLRLSLK